MLVVVTFISFLVHFYSIGYMEENPHFTRFMSYLSIFTFFMLILVTADNILQMFLGWEGVGIASYLLINFWFTRLFANQSALKALITNRIGDFGLSIAILLLFCNFVSLDYLTNFFGSLTAFFAALTGSFQNDLKKIIAYSTCSQLGYMIFSCGLSHYNISIFI